MKKLLVASLALLTAVSCSTTLVKLTNTEFTAPNAAKFNVVFFKTKSKGYDLSISGTSTTGKSLVIRKDEVSCGRGAVVGQIRGIGRVGNDPYITIPSESYKEFHVYCGNKDIITAEGDFYVKFKNIYDTNVAGQPDKVIASDIKFDLK